jgi:hypothetical protein
LLAKAAEDRSIAKTFEAALTRIGRDYCRRGRCAKAPVGHSPDILQTHQQKTTID